MKAYINYDRLKEVREKLRIYRDEHYVPMIRHYAVYDALILLNSIMDEADTKIIKAIMKRGNKKNEIQV